MLGRPRHAACDRRDHASSRVEPRRGRPWGARERDASSHRSTPSKWARGYALGPRRPLYARRVPHGVASRSSDGVYPAPPSRRGEPGAPSDRCQDRRRLAKGLGGGVDATTGQSFGSRASATPAHASRARDRRNQRNLSICVCVCGRWVGTRLHPRHGRWACCARRGAHIGRRATGEPSPTLGLALTDSRGQARGFPRATQSPQRWYTPMRR